MPNPTQSLATRRAAARSLRTAIAPLERRYAAALRSLAVDVADAYMRLLKPHLKADSLANEFLVLGMHVQLATEQHVGKLFDRHAASVVAANKRAMRVIGVPLVADTGLAADIERRRKENIDLVVNAQREYAASVKEIFEDPANDGLAVDVLKEKLLERGSVSESRAELIARDQTLKLNGAITELRQTNAGVSEYIWSTSQDERVREEHAALEGQTFSWSSPPDVGHPGEDFQCRCIAVPVIDELADV